MRLLSCLVAWIVVVTGVSLTSTGCGASGQQDRCRNSSGMPQGDMPCYEPPPSSPQREKEDEQHTPPGNPMPSH